MCIAGEASFTIVIYDTYANIQDEHRSNNYIV